MKKYKVSKELKPYVRKILMQSFHSCRMSVDSSGQTWCETDASAKVFHRVVQRAKCELKTLETGIFQVTSAEAANPYRLNLLLKQAGTSCYQVVDDMDGARQSKYV